MARPADDFELLERYARARDEPAFAEVVRRHLNLVYSAAVRRVGDRHLAEDVTQAVFVILAKKANSVRSSMPMGAWLLTAVRYAAANALKIEARRRQHEAAAAARVAAAGAASAACSSNPTDVLLSAALPKGKSLVHYTGGFGIALSGKSELNVGLDVSSESTYMTASGVIRF